jgi:quinol monooxygenase YgiN
MYGTIARFRAKPGSEADLIALSSDDSGPNADGYAFHHVYRLDSGNDEYMLVVGFRDRESYMANANSPEQNEFYEKFRALLAADPEWHDGEIVDSQTA